MRGMSQSIRVFYRQLKGVAHMNFNWPPISKHSAVLMTAAEVQSSPFGDFRGSPRDALANLRSSLGDASVWVSNVGPHGDTAEAGGVEFQLHVDWGTPLDIMVTITVLDDIEDYFGAT